MLEVARADLARYQKLAAQDSIARQQLDTQAGTVHQLEGTVAADRASVGTARLDINYAAVKAPITGRIGLKQVSIGSYVTPGDTNGIATVTRTDPIDVQFALPQSALGQVRKQAFQSSTRDGLPVTAFDQDNVTVLAKGHFSTLDNQVATATGTISAKARFDNPGDTASQALFPNQFVNVRLLVDTLHHVPVVPVNALRHGAPGDFVYVVKPDQTVKLTVVRIGASDGMTTAVLSGLSAGEQVVTEGADGLDDGAKVRLPRGSGGGGGAAADAPAGPAAPSATGQHKGGKHHQHAPAVAAG